MLFPGQNEKNQPDGKASQRISDSVLKRGFDSKINNTPSNSFGLALHSFVVLFIVIICVRKSKNKPDLFLFLPFRFLIKAPKIS
jgi:hypothetical protein